MTFTFDPEVLGGLPTHVGVVLTDAFTANVNARVSATSSCASLGELSTDVTFGDGSIGGETEEDRFVGLVVPAGMTRVTVNVGGPLELDHLQLGFRSACDGHLHSPGASGAELVTKRAFRGVHERLAIVTRDGPDDEDPSVPPVAVFALAAAATTSSDIECDAAPGHGARRRRRRRRGCRVGIVR